MMTDNAAEELLVHHRPQRDWHPMDIIIHIHVWNQEFKEGVMQHRLHNILCVYALCGHV